MLGTFDAVRMFERCAAERAIAFDEGVAMKQPSWRGLSSLPCRHLCRHFLKAAEQRNVETNLDTAGLTARATEVS